MEANEQRAREWLVANNAAGMVDRFPSRLKSLAAEFAKVRQERDAAWANALKGVLHDTGHSRRVVQSLCQYGPPEPADTAPRKRMYGGDTMAREEPEDWERGVDPAADRDIEGLGDAAIKAGE